MFRRRRKTAKLEGPLTDESLRAWLIQHLAERVDLPPAEIDSGKTFEEYGLDSRVAVQVSGELEKIVERRLSPGVLYDHPTIDALSRYLTRELQLAERTG